MPDIEDARSWYRADDPVHGIDHILRVRALALYLARLSKADARIVEAAALLHDASGGDAMEGERSTHHERSAGFARQILEAEDWEEQDINRVVECIAAHRYRGGDSAQSLEAQILYDADKLDVIGAFGAARTIAYAVEADQPVYAEVSKDFIKTGKTEAGEPHSAYHEYLFKLRNVRKTLFTQAAKELAEDREKILVALFEGLANEATFGADKTK
jgi:uncharacterized protein